VSYVELGVPSDPEYTAMGGSSTLHRVPSDPEYMSMGGSASAAAAIAAAAAAAAIAAAAAVADAANDDTDKALYNGDEVQTSEFYSLGHRGGSGAAAATTTAPGTSTATTNAHTTAANDTNDVDEDNAFVPSGNRAVRVVSVRAGLQGASGRREDVAGINRSPSKA
jgi:hypothetical protein